MLTIVIPYFKLKYFCEALDSLSRQTLMDFRVIIGNDGSPEDPLEVLKEFRETLNVTCVDFEENLGSLSLVNHWKRCLDLVTTEWCIILGDDDFLAPDAVEKFYEALKNNRSASVFKFNRQIIDGSGNNVGNPQIRPEDEKSTDFLYQRSLNKVGSSLGEYVFRTSAYKKYGIRDYPNAFYSDNMMVMEYSGFGYVGKIDSTAYIRISENSLSGDEKNRNVIRRAGWFFYYDILKEYSTHFNAMQRSHFLNIIIGGISNGVLPLSKVEFIKLAAKNVGLFRAARKMITLLKR